MGVLIRDDTLGRAGAILQYINPKTGKMIKEERYNFKTKKYDLIQVNFAPLDFSDKNKKEI